MVCTTILQSEFKRNEHTLMGKTTMANSKEEQATDEEIQWALAVKNAALGPGGANERINNQHQRLVRLGLFAARHCGKGGR